MTNPLLIIALFLVISFAARDIIAQAALEEGIKMVTGLRSHISKLSIGLRQPIIRIKGMQLYNPQGYPDPVMAEVDAIDINYSFKDLLKGKVTLRKLHLTLKQVFILRKPGNKLNVDSLKALEMHSQTQPVIDDFSLDIGQVVYKDYGHRPKPLVKSYALNMNEHCNDVRGTEELRHVVQVGILEKTSLASLVRVDLNKITAGLSGTLLNSLRFSSDSLRGLLDHF